MVVRPDPMAARIDGFGCRFLLRTGGVWRVGGILVGLKDGLGCPLRKRSGGEDMTDKEKLAEIESVLIRLKGTRFLLKAARAADASSDCDEREREQALDRAVDLLDEDLAELANILYLT